MSKDPKSTETQKENNQEMRTESPVENTQAQEVTKCHPVPDQKTSASAESQNPASIPLLSNPDQWCSCNGECNSSNVYLFILPRFVSKLPEKDISSVVVQCR